MKPSHFTTPRSMSECYFDPRGQAIFNETPKAESILSDTALMVWFAAIGLVGAIIFIIWK